MPIKDGVDKPTKTEAQMQAENIVVTLAILSSLKAFGLDESASVCALLTAATTLIHQTTKPEQRLSTLNAFLAPTLEEWRQVEASGRTIQ